MVLDSPWITNVASGREVMELFSPTTKFVVLVVHQPWCGHCRWFAKALHDFARGVQKRMDNVVVAAITGDSPAVRKYFDRIGVTGYPSTFVFKRPDAYRPIGTLGCYQSRFSIERTVAEGKTPEEGLFFARYFEHAALDKAEDQQTVYRYVAVNCLRELEKMVRAHSLVT